MSLEIIRAAIVAKAQAVPDFGRVHAYERYVREEKAFRDLYLVERADGTDLLAGWWLRRTATEELGIAIRRTVDVHTWQLRGYRALNDAEASELAFDASIEALRDAVRADPTFGGVCEPEPTGGAYGSSNEPQYVAVQDAGPVMFCGVLCHSAVLQLKTWSFR